MGTVVAFRKASLAERVARRYGYQVKAVTPADGTGACRALGVGVTFQCYDPHGSYPETDYYIHARHAWQAACNNIWSDRFVERHGQAMHDRYVENGCGFSPESEIAA